MSTPRGRTFYYAVKPYLPWRARLGVRRFLAKRFLRKNTHRWPIDENTAAPPPGWIGWPDGKPFGFVITHDVEGPEGLARCRRLAELEIQLGFRSSFNFIPEGTYSVPAETRDWLTAQGFEVGVHDLNHDGKLYQSRQSFTTKAAKINRYLADWGARGYRSGFMLHNYEWHHDLAIEYDATSFDTDPFEPQPDGCGSIFPFWISRPDSAIPSASTNSAGHDRKGYVEIPYTLPQDSTLFLVLGEKGPDIWLKKLEWIRSKGGLALVNVHPDYLHFPDEPSRTGTFPVEHYINLLKYLKLELQGNYWHATPRTLAQWFRSAMVKDSTISTVPPAMRRPLLGKRAAVLLYSYYPADPRPRRAAEALVEAGMEVDLFCLQENHTDARREVVNGVNVYRVPLRKRKETKFTYIWRYSTFVISCASCIAFRLPFRRYDLVHTHNMPDFIAFGALPARLNGAKVILDLHDPMPELMTSIFDLPPSHWLVRTLRWVERTSIGFVHLAVTPNLAFKRLFVSRSCSADKMQIVMNSPQETIFNPDRYNDAGSQVNGEFRIMHHGSIVHRHGIDQLVEAVASLRAHIPRIRLDIYGAPNAFLDTVLETAKRLKVDDCVHYHGAKTQAEIAEAIRLCSLGVVPNRRSTFTETNFPTRLFEYLALHRPVIAPKTEGILDYFAAEDMLFFEPGNVDDLTAQILHAYEHPNETQETVRRGREVYRKHLWSREKAHYIKLVTDLLVR